MYLAESLTCDNICEAGASVVMAVAFFMAIVYCIVIAISIYVFRRSKISHKSTLKRTWLWRLWFVLLTIPGIVWLGSLVLS